MAKLYVQVGLVGVSALFLAYQASERFAPVQAVAPPAIKEVARPEAGPRIVALKGDDRGHFETDVSINGQFVRVLVDTGASIVALTQADAQKARIFAPKTGQLVIAHTANGKVSVPQVRIPELRLQSLVVRDVEAVIMPPEALKVTLLGMSFLKRLKSFEMNGSTLALKQ